MNRLAAAAMFAAALAACSYDFGKGERRDMTKRDLAESRRCELARANIIAVHAYQILLCREAGKGDKDCFDPGALTDAGLEALVSHQASLLKDDAVEISKWLDGGQSSFDPEKDLKPLLSAPLKLSGKLPVSVFAEYLSKSGKEAGRRPPESHVLAVANLYQTVLETERDGTVLWDEMDFYIALGYPTYVGQFGLPGGDEDFLRVGKKLAPLTCDAPFPDSPTTPFAWQIAGRKIWNWGEKNLHVRDQYVMARELLAEPDIRVLVPSIKALPPQRIAIVGHSFTMNSHWSTPGSFAAVVGAALDMTNPTIEYRQWGAGGLTATRAYKNFYSDVLAWKPDKVLFAVAMRTDQDLADLKTMCAGLAAAGAGVYTFDNLRDPSEDAVRNQMDERVAKETGMTIIEVGKLLAAAPDKKEFLCLDKIHMTEPYHRLMAREWLKFLVGARDARLAE